MDVGAMSHTPNGVKTPFGSCGSSDNQWELFIHSAIETTIGSSSDNVVATILNKNIIVSGIILGIGIDDDIQLRLGIYFLHIRSPPFVGFDLLTFYSLRFTASLVMTSKDNSAALGSGLFTK